MLESNAVILTLISSVVFYGIGFMSGWLIRSRIIQNEFSFNEGSLVLVVVTAIWALSVVYDIASIDYDTPMIIHGLMGAIVGFFYKPSLDSRK